jgi:hypothetical protein
MSGPRTRPARYALHHIDSCHVPDDDEVHAPPSNAPTRVHSPVPEDRTRHSSGTEHTLTGEHGDAEKRARRRGSGPQEKERVPAEQRDWEDDIVT